MTRLLSSIAIMSATIAALISLAACRDEAAQVPETADLALANVTVVDVETGALLPGQTILIDGRMIVGVVSSAQSSTTVDEVVDATGHYAVPGLWDTHVHSAAAVSWHFPLLVAHGVTSVRNMHSTVDTALALTTSIERHVSSGELTGPRFLANGPIIDGYPPAWPGALAIATPAAARAAVDSLAAGGARFIKVYDGLTPDVHAAILERAEMIGIPVDGHVPFLVAPEDAARGGQRTVEHTTGMNLGCSTRADSLRGEFRTLRERLPSMRFPDNVVAFFTLVRAASDTRDETLCAETVRAYVEAGVSAVPTLVIGTIDAPALVADAGKMSLLPASIRAQWTEMVGWGPDPIDAVFIGSEWTTPRNTGLMYQAGVPILAGTDIGNPFLIPGLSLHDELSLLVTEAGLSPIDALRTATINPARTFGMADSLGSLAAGQLADLVILERNPLDDITATRSIAGVVLNGRFLDREALDALLAEAASAEE